MAEKAEVIIVHHISENIDIYDLKKCQDDESEGPGAWSDEEESNESDSEEETSRRKRPKAIFFQQFYFQQF